MLYYDGAALRMADWLAGSHTVVYLAVDDIQIIDYIYNTDMNRITQLN